MINQLICLIVFLVLVTISCMAHTVVNQDEVDDRLHHLFNKSQNDLVVYCGNVTIYFSSCDAYGCNYENLTFSDCDSYEPDENPGDVARRAVLRHCGK